MSRGLLILIASIATVATIGVGGALLSDDDEPAPRANLQSAMPRTPQPQPPGPAPAGKVWSAEHGHWHDANPASGPTPENPVQVVRRNVPQPPGPVPAGKVWSPEHGHWHTKKK